MKEEKEEITLYENEQEASLARLVANYVNGKGLLSKKDELLFERLATADELLKEMGLDKRAKISKMLKNRYNICLSAAYRTIKQSEELFNQIENIDRQTASRVLLHSLEKYIQMCEKELDMKNLAKFMKIKSDVIINLISSKQVDVSSLEATQIVFSFGGAAPNEINPQQVREMIQKMKLTLIEKEKLIEDANICSD